MADADCTVKKCRKCGEPKPLELFYFRSDRSGKPRSECIACTAVRNGGPAYYAQNKARLLAAANARYERDREAIRERAAAYRASPKGRASRMVREATVSESLAKRIRSQLRHMLRSGKAGRPSVAILGWSIADLSTHLEAQFVRGMSWENMGEWHIDHITPLANFTITGPDDPELRRAWSLANLRPLWAADNLRKGARRTHLI